MGNMRFKKGDRVRIKSLDWYNENKDKVGNILYKRDGSAYPFFFSKYMSNFCGKVVTIEEVYRNFYTIIDPETDFYWTDEMIEGLVEEETKPNITEEAKTYWDSIKDAWICPEGYIFKDENGNVINATKIVLEKKKNEYPKTYEECCKIFGLNHYLGLSWNSYDEYSGVITGLPKRIDDIAKKLESLSKLLICRDAYWKIAGEEMGLNGPWKPDWEDGNLKWCMSYSGNCIEFDQYKSKHHILAFPTEEIRDVFFENFKEEIEACKELL